MLRYLLLNYCVFLFVQCHYQGECQDFVCDGGFNDTGNVSPAAVGTVILGAQ